MPREQITRNDPAFVLQVAWGRQGSEHAADKADQPIQIGVEVNADTRGDATLIRSFFAHDPGMVAWLGNMARFTAEAVDREVPDGLNDDKLNTRDLHAGYLLLTELDKYIGHRSVWATIDDRREVNHLIATLRRARDAAFGKDE